LAGAGTHFGVSLEDATRTPPADLDAALEVTLATGAEWITICDTVGEMTPRGTHALVDHVREVVEARRPAVRLVWHGHNDKGLALANALAAADAGVHVISGAFLGIGERAGNTALEQVLMALAQAGSTRYRLDGIPAYCRRLAEYTRTDVALNAPLVGRQVFATCTGTHSAAILKARALGRDFEDLVFSGVPAHALGRRQEILIGPTSGLANVRHGLEDLGVSAPEGVMRRLLEYAKTRDAWLGPEDVRAFLAGPVEAA
ncbi:MAG TPA: 2-isopropylmalate synthase, partial [Methylomirabilota bacterium]|nr:2-isopropylmalate synthase [Methylomirabilota bacterium]